jgi:hypothetical protein
MKVVWLDLNQICKYYELIKKTEKEKKEKRKKIEKGSGSHFGPATEAATAQHRLRPKGYASSPLPR